MPRNGSGVYTLPSGNPVEPGTVIEADWANSTLEDVGEEITNSLSRTGEGGMLAPFRLFDGTAGAPGMSWLLETSSGFYRAGAGEYWATVLGVPIQQFTVNGVLIPSSKSLTAQGNATVGGTLGVTGAVTMSSTLAVTGAITATGGVNGNITSSSVTITGGTINGTPIGGTTRAAGAFTTLSANAGITGDLTGNVTGNVSGNAGTVTNGVYTTGSYANPAWITSLAGSKITGNISGNAANVTGTVAVANGGTGATTAADARTNLSVPSTTGTGATGTWNIDVLGNAGTVTNGVYTTGSYANPTWITSLAANKLTGTVAVANGGTGQSSYVNGELLIGNSTGNTLTKSTLTAGSGVTITNGSGSITISATGTGGDVVGPASATDNAIARYDGTTGKIIQDSAVYITDAGNVGVNTTAPTNFGANYRTLHVAGGNTTNGGVFRSSNSNDSVVGDVFVDGTTFNVRAGTSTNLALGANNTAHVYLDTAGNFGIGTSSPGAKLDVQTSAQTLLRLKGGAGASESAALYVTKAGSATTLAAFGDSAAILGGTVDQAVNIYADGGVPITFNQSTSERFRIGPSGQIGLGGANYGTSGQVLTSNGAGAAPTWQTASGGGITMGKAIAAALIFG